MSGFQLITPPAVAAYSALPSALTARPRTVTAVSSGSRPARRPSASNSQNRTFPVEVPALHERKSDIPLLVNFFLTKFARKHGKEIKGVSKNTMDRLSSYPWPGNIRELQNVIERAVVVSEGPEIEIDESLLRLNVSSKSQASDTLEDVERTHILRILEQTGWVIDGKQGAAFLLGMNPNTLRSRMQKLGIKRRGLGVRD